MDGGYYALDCLNKRYVLCLFCVCRELLSLLRLMIDMCCASCLVDIYP